MDLHDHDHHDHHHDDHAVATEERPMDAASQSLADALKLSFRILTVIMLVIVGAFLASGLSIMNSDEIGVKKVLGRIVGTSPSSGGLTYTWPWPIGEIQRVKLRPDPLRLWDFWPAVPAGQDKLDLSKMKIDRKGLTPGVDGALLSGDQSLFHAYIECQYEIRRPILYVQQVANLQNDPDTLREFPDVDPQVLNLWVVLRAVVDQAAVTVAAQRTAYDIVLRDTEGFNNAVMQLAQKNLDKALGVTRDQDQAVVVSKITSRVGWPVNAQQAYQNAQTADADRVKKHNDAVKEARGILNKAAGAGYVKLVRDPEDNGPLAADPDHDLIGQYTRTRDELTQVQRQLQDAQEASAPNVQELQATAAKLDKQAGDLLSRIDQVLESNDIRGDANIAITHARDAKAQYIATAQWRDNNFRTILAKYNESPQLVLRTLWAQVSDQILSSNLVEKFIINPSTQRTVIQISRDPNFLKQIADEQTKADKEKAEQARFEESQRAAEAAQ